MATNADDIMLGRLDRLLSKTNIEKKMWINRDFIFGDYFTNNQKFRNKVLDFYSQGNRKDDLFNKIALLDNYDMNDYYYNTLGNAFEAYKELEGLDTTGMKKKVVGHLKSLNYTEKELRQHFELLQDGADFINWQGSRDFIDYDSNLYNSVNNVEQQAASRQRRRGNRNNRTHTASSDPQTTGPAGPKIGDNFLNRNGDQVVIADIYDNWNGTNYAMVNQNGKRVEESFLDDYTPYKGDKPIDAKIAKDFSDKWSELRNLKDEFMDFRRKNPNWSAQERLDWIKEKVDPVVKSLNDYNSNMNKYLGTRRVFDKHDYNTYIRDFAKDQKKFARAEIKQQQAQQTQQTQQQTQQTQQVQTASDTQSTGRQRHRGNKKRTTSNAFEDDLDVAIESRNTPWRYTRGENFWDKKHNRHYVYDGIYNGYGGRYVLYDKEGNASVVDEETMNSFSKYKGKNPLDLDRQVDYNIALDDYEHFRKQDKIKYKNPDAYYTQLKNIMDKIDNYETEIGKSYKNFRGNKNYHKSREYVSDEVKAHFDKKNANQQQQTREQAQRQAEQQAREQTQQAQQRKNINQDDPASWTDDDIKLMADGDPDAANHLMKEREKARQQQQTRRTQQTQQAQQTRQTQNNQNRTRINRKAAAWTDEEIANMADGDLDVYNELIKKRETAREQIKQREEQDRIKKERNREIKEDRKRRRQEQINSRKKNNINEKEYSSMWENLLNEQEQQKNVDDLFFGNGNTGGGSSYNYDIPDDETVVKTVEDWLESNFNNRDYTVNGNSSASDIDFWASWTDDDILQISEDLVGDYDDDTISKIMDKMIEFREFSINHKNTNTNTNTNTNSGGGGSSANNSSGANSGSSGSGGASGGSSNASGGGGGSNSGGSSGGGSSNSTGGSSSSTKTHLYKRNGKMRQLSHGSSKYSANTKFKVNTNSGHLPRTSNKAVKTIGVMSALNTVFNVAGAVSDYKNARREGKGVVGATLKAGTEFALGEMLGLKGQLALFAVRAIPSAAIAGADMLYKESRRMNSAANQGVFGNAQFQDTQQLATMRQSGMEMAKMANYNLQQTLMGNEATYFHR